MWLTHLNLHIHIHIDINISDPPIIENLPLIALVSLLLIYQKSNPTYLLGPDPYISKVDCCRYIFGLASWLNIRGLTVVLLISTIFHHRIFSILDEKGLWFNYIGSGTQHWLMFPILYGRCQFKEVASFFLYHWYINTQPHLQYVACNHIPKYMSSTSNCWWNQYSIASVIVYLYSQHHVLFIFANYLGGLIYI